MLLAAAVLCAGCQKRAPEAVVSEPVDAGAAPVAVAVAPSPGAFDSGQALDSARDERTAPRFIVRDNKMRCVQAPCMSLDAMPVNSSAATEKISDVDLSALGLSDKEQQSLLAEVYGKRGLEVEGEIVEQAPTIGKGGPARVLKVTRVHMQ